MVERPVVVVGAGLAGLACAVRLRRDGVQVLLLEAGDAVGGRVRSDAVEGFTIDRGFQVLNTAYPALRTTVDLAALDLRPLPRGVRVRRDGRLHELPHPLSSAGAPLRAVASGAVGLRGKLGLARYAAGVVLGSPASVKSRPDVPATQAWASLPSEVVRGVLDPFLSGVVLEQPVTTSRVFTDLMMRMFALGTSALPAAGMKALPATLARRLPADAIRLETPVARVGATSVELGDGTVVPARAVVVATDPWVARDLVPDLGPAPEPRGVTTFYFAAPRWRGADGTLVVDADGSAVTNSVVLTESAPEYSTDGRALIATSVLDRGPVPDADVAVVRDLAAELHGTTGEAWELVATRAVPRALPAMAAPHPLRRPVHLPGPDVGVARHHRDTSSIQGALVSGRRAALSVLRRLDGTVRSAAPRRCAVDRAASRTYSHRTAT
jgi:hypothetical protein